MSKVLASLLACATSVLAASAAHAAAQSLSGAVTSRSGQKLEGVTVSAKLEGSTIATSVYTDAAGNYYFPPLPAGKYRVWAQALGFEMSKSAVDLSAERRADFTLQEMTDPERRFRQLPGEMMVAALPEASADDARAKKIFMNNCTGCHSSSYVLQFRFDEAGWSKIIDLMKVVPVTGVYPGPNAKSNQIMERHQKQLAAYLARARGPGESSMKMATRARQARHRHREDHDLPDSGKHGSGGRGGHHRRGRQGHDLGVHAERRRALRSGGREVHRIQIDDPRAQSERLGGDLRRGRRSRRQRLVGANGYGYRLQGRRRRRQDDRDQDARRQGRSPVRRGPRLLRNRQRPGLQRSPALVARSAPHGHRQKRRPAVGGQFVRLVVGEDQYEDSRDDDRPAAGSRDAGVSHRRRQQAQRVGQPVDRGPHRQARSGHQHVDHFRSAGARYGNPPYRAARARRQVVRGGAGLPHEPNGRHDGAQRGRARGPQSEGAVMPHVHDRDFKRQTREFADALKNAGKQVKLVYAEGYNYFEIAETIANPYGFVGRAILEQMQLA